VLGYLEFHIEQGPVLEHRETPLGIVEAIAGQTRMELVFTGFAAMLAQRRCRCDAMRSLQPRSGLAVEKEALEIPGLVATVGALEAKPGAANVIAGECRATVDVRHASDAARTQSVERHSSKAQRKLPGAAHRLTRPQN